MRKNRVTVAVFAAVVFIITLAWLFNRRESGRRDIEVPIPASNAADALSFHAKTASEFDEEPKRMDQPDAFYEFHCGIRTRDGESEPSYKMNYQIVELLKAKGVNSTLALSKASNREPLSWVERGPGNVAGRTRGLIVDPDDPALNTWYLGSVGGGVWKTTDAGQTWQELTAGLTNLATSALAMAASNPNVIYAGTGEGFGNADQIAGNGLWKSVDRGQTWQQMANTINNNFRHITRLIVDPHNENILLASTNTGLHRSTDGGQTWTRVYASSARAEQIIANPQNFKTQFASVYQYGVIKSVDGGVTWRDSFRFSSGIGRMEIAIAPSDTSRLYISAEGVAPIPGAKLYLSEDAGATWSLAIPEDTANIDFLGGQGWYDNTIAVHPYDANIVFAGGASIWRFEVRSGPTMVDRTFAGIDFVNTASFLSLTNVTGSLSGVVVGNIPTSEQVSVEIRFGPGRSQRAHRFTVPPGSTSGVPDANYTYRDYIDVPFEVWDIDNNLQLMVSFRDQLDDGTFNLEVSNSARSREYIFVQAVPYAATPSPDIAQNAGHVFKQLFNIWPVLPTNGTWDPANLPVSTFRVRWENITTKQIARSIFQDSYQQFGGTHKGVHPDHHNLVLVPTNPAQNGFRFLNANDGGISYSDDGGATFKQTGQGFNIPGALTGYNTSQFYGLDKMNGASRYIGGTQDNGSYFSPADPNVKSEWVHAPSGDGFEAAWNYRDPDKMLESSQYNSIYLSINGGTNWRQAGPSDRGSATGPFFTKIAKSIQDPDLVFATGASGLWRSDNFAANWTLTRMPQGFVGNSFYSQVEISLASPQVVWAGRSLNTTTPIFVSTDGGFSFTPTQTYSVNLGSVTGIATNPTDEKTAYVLFSFAGAPKVLRTTDLGQTWTELSGFGTNSTSSNGFPDVATYCLLVMPFDTNIIWAGTEIGLFESKDGGATWAYADNGLPPVSIWEMIIVNDEVALATHGRGIWSVRLPQLAGYEPPAVMLSPRIRELGGGFGGVVSTTLGLASAYDSTIVSLDGARFFKLGANAAAKDTSLQLIIPVDAPRVATFSLLSYREGKRYQSNPFNLQLWPLLQARAQYNNNFDNPTQAAADFGADGLVFNAPTGFSDGMLNSPHNYAANRTYSAVLLAPIIVAATDATLEYKDIAIVHPGEESSKFGEEDFFDYVVVEGSKDFGRTWQPLADGYDARADSLWLAAYNARQPGTPSMFVNHKLNLLDTFASGDQVIIRFRLFSDPNAVGWGWAVDNLVIQEKVTSVASSGSSLPTAFSLAQNYPNPFNPSTKIQYALPKPTEVRLTIFNTFGQKVRTLIDGEKKEPGAFAVEWDGKNDAGQPVVTGVYFYKLTTKDYVRTLKMLLVK